MRHPILLALVAFWLVLMPQLASAAGIDQATIERMGKTLERAFIAKDAKTVSDSIADDFTMTMEIMGQVYTLDKKQYMAMLKRGWKVIENYQYDVKNMNVTIDSPTKAIINADVMESLVVNGLIIKGYTEQETWVEMRNGKPLATRVTAHISVYASVEL